MSFLIWHLRRGLETLGKVGLVGLILVITSFVLYVLLLLPAEEKYNSQLSKITSIDQHSHLAKSLKFENSISSFWNLFPSKSEINNQIRTIHQIAKKQKIEIDRIDYKHLKFNAPSLFCYQITFSINSDYRTLRYFISELLKQLPNATMESIDFERENSDQAEINSTIKLALYFRDY